MSGFPLRCSGCGGLDLELLAGEELMVDALELADDRTGLELAEDRALGEQLITST
jgi:hypothetical protein